MVDGCSKLGVIFRTVLPIALRLVEEELRRLDLRTKGYVARAGRQMGDPGFTRGHLSTNFRPAAPPRRDRLQGRAVLRPA